MLVAPSLLEGDCGWAPCEAIFCGVPTVVADTDFTHEFLNNGTLYANPDDPEDFSKKINDILQNRDLKNELVSNGLRALSFYTMEQAIIRFFNLLNKF